MGTMFDASGSTHWSGKKFICRADGTHFARRSTAIRHVLAQHLQVQMFPCTTPHCPFTALTSYHGMLSHYRHHHPVYQRTGRPAFNSNPFPVANTNSVWCGTRSRIEVDDRFERADELRDHLTLVLGTNSRGPLNQETRFAAPLNGPRGALPSSFCPVEGQNARTTGTEMAYLDFVVDFVRSYMHAVADDPVANDATISVSLLQRVLPSAFLKMSPHILLAWVQMGYTEMDYRPDYRATRVAAVS
ncbi:hypothetical protein RvY_02717 [Ramazzottius varieornatus]|uniref:Uncharacterized protein n=1 Tax=Ramazzottius varieornatus TaxID=947166 RepID=A0A1D1UKP6_RAMVA|nr:hypothetical protein RvY_02717 [Ramazzottius varieornatus]